LYFDEILPTSVTEQIHASLDGQGMLPAFFFGDLDFSGMGILASFRLAYPRLEAWQTGYEPLLRELTAGRSHLPVQAQKEAQLDPGNTGCPYADGVLLPALRSHSRFVDQECLSVLQTAVQVGR
jgi:hypothetical protein